MRIGVSPVATPIAKVVNDRSVALNWLFISVTNVKNAELLKSNPAANRKRKANVNQAAPGKVKTTVTIAIKNKPISTTRFLPKRSAKKAERLLPARLPIPIKEKAKPTLVSEKL